MHKDNFKLMKPTTKDYIVYVLHLHREPKANMSSLLLEIRKVVAIEGGYIEWKEA